MSTTFTVSFPNGKDYEIGGMPLCSEEKFKKLFPELSKTLDENFTIQYDEGYTPTPEEDIEAVCRLERYVFGIIKHFNKEANFDEFYMDRESWRETLSVWKGFTDDSKKKIQ